MKNNYVDYYGDQTRWFIGAVVSINDPLEVGRVRVRIYGVHSDNKVDIPDTDLPWAQVVVPVTQGGTGGYGSNIGIQVGAEVFGIFLDGKDSQLPLVLGSIPKREKSVNNSISTNLLARTDMGDLHPSYAKRAKGRVNDNGFPLQYYTARPPRVTSVAPDKESPADYYSVKYWIEPPIADDELIDYPNNHVYETPGGHVVEFDNTPGRERFHRYHPSGSYEEVISTGQRTLKVVGPDYELYLDSSSIVITGDYNVTVAGNKRELIQGNYHLEVQGDMTMNLHQSLQKKVAFNYETEIGKFRVTNVAEDDNLTILNGNQNLNIAKGSRIENIKTDDTRTVIGNISSINYGTYNIYSDGATSVTAGGALTITSDGIVTFETTKSMDVTSTLPMTLTVETDGGDLTLVGGPNIELNP